MTITKKENNLIVGSLVRQTIYEDKKRYGIIYKVIEPSESDYIYWVFWQLNVNEYAVSNQAYVEPILWSNSIKIGRPLELVKKPVILTKKI